MVGRKALVLSAADVNGVIDHIKSLPFKRKIQERFVLMMQGKKSIQDFSAADLDLVKKCRYEMNAYHRQMEALARIKAQSSHSSFERDILDLSKRTDIDAYFLMLDALKMYLKKADQKQAEAKLKNDKKRMEKKQEDSKSIARKQRDRENYFLGAALRKLFDTTGVFSKKRNDLDRLCTVVNCARLVELLIEQQAIDLKKYDEILRNSKKGQEFDQTVQELIQDLRNPFK